MPEPDFSLEAACWRRGWTPVAGIDEAGRGALAGPVVAAAVILVPGELPYRDSKQLDAPTRERLAEHIEASAVAWAVACAEPDEIDRWNVLQATRVAALRAVRSLSVRPGALVTDYLDVAADRPVVAVARGDGRSASVAAASILAKVARDRMMREMDETYPGFGFAAHKGYGSQAHLAALDALGPCAIHRRTFKPVAQARLFG